MITRETLQFLTRDALRDTWLRLFDKFVDRAGPDVERLISSILWHSRHSDEAAAEALVGSEFSEGQVSIRENPPEKQGT
jgi:hypothetical protein